MGCQDGESGHGIDRKGLRDGCCQGLSKERNPTLSLTARREKLPFEAFLPLRDEERRGTETSSTTNTSINLMVEQFLDMVDGQEMLTVHGDDDSVPNLRDEDLKREKNSKNVRLERHVQTHLRLVLYLHVACGQQFCIDPFG